MTRRLLNFLRRPLRDKGLLMQAWLLLGLARIAILTIQFKRLAKYLGEPSVETPTELSEEEMERCRRVSWAVQRASRFTPWTSNCFPQAIVAQHLLWRRRISSTIYFGLKMEESKPMQAHAWVRCGPRIVTGRAGYKKYQVVGAFTRS